MGSNEPRSATSSSAPADPSATSTNTLPTRTSCSRTSSREGFDGAHGRVRGAGRGAALGETNIFGLDDAHPYRRASEDLLAFTIAHQSASSSCSLRARGTKHERFSNDVVRLLVELAIEHARDVPDLRGHARDQAHADADLQRLRRHPRSHPRRGARRARTPCPRGRRATRHLPPVGSQGPLPLSEDQEASR